MDKKDLLDLLKTNTDKMNFQQNMCFQLQNWALAFTIGLISINWTICEIRNCLWISVALHFLLIILLLHLLIRNRKWMVYFILFRERAVMLENMIFKHKIKPNFKFKYFKYHFANTNKVCIDAITDEYNIELLKSCIYFILLICIALASFIFSIYYGNRMV